MPERSPQTELIETVGFRPQGERIELRFSPTAEVYPGQDMPERQGPPQAVNRVLGLAALTKGNFAIMGDTDDHDAHGRIVDTEGVGRILAESSRNRNVLAAVFADGRPMTLPERGLAIRADLAEHPGDLTSYRKRDGEAVAYACRRGDLRWQDVPKGMPVQFFFGWSGYYPVGPGQFERSEQISYDIELNSKGGGVFKTKQGIMFAEPGMFANFGENYRKYRLLPGKTAECFSGKGLSERALALGSVAVAGQHEQDIWRGWSDYDPDRTYFDSSEELFIPGIFRRDDRIVQTATLVNVEFDGVPANPVHRRK